MSKKKLTPDEELRRLENELLQAGPHWGDIYENGCSDPFWSDGTNLNLIRNHCLYYVRLITELCEQHSMPLPDILPFPMPDEVDPDYMAPNGRYPNRLKRHEPVSEPIVPMQLSLEF